MWMHGKRGFKLLHDVSRCYAVVFLRLLGRTLSAIVGCAHALQARAEVVPRCVSLLMLPSDRLRLWRGIAQT